MERYRYSAERLAFVERSPIPYAIYQFINMRVVTVAISDGFCKLGGYGTDRERACQDMNNSMYRNVHPDDAARVAESALRFAMDDGNDSTYDAIYRLKCGDNPDYTIIHATGEHFYTETGERLAIIWYTDEGIYDREGTSKHSLLNKTLSRALREESLIKASHYDYLTGLPNMSYFFELVEAGRIALYEEGKHPAIMFFDLNGMKYYNSKHGFAEGDKLLRAFAKLLSRFFGNENCGHLNSDHFAVYTDETGLTETLEELFVECEKLNGGRSLPVRVGIVRAAMEDIDPSTACDRAKMACDAIRTMHSSSYRFFTEALRDEVSMRQYVVDNLDRAISEGWITVYYQPIVRAVNGRVCDEEALARWIDPEKGFLSPAEFIPYLEDARLIYKLDLRVLELVIDKLKVQEESGLHLVPQSINLSRSDFDSCDIVEEICGRVDAAGIRRDLITIEITESIVGGDFDFMKEQIERFQNLGFPVWMDDFGSGYSSLDVLQSIKFDLLKFDMRFLRDFDYDNAGKTILTELTKMATALGVDTICEGVETAEQVRFLREIGCSKLQGYFYTPPLSLERVLERYEKGVQIGFENPEESTYFESIGRVNLYDLASLTRGGVRISDAALDNIFNTLPMAIVEVKDDGMRYVRSNPSYRSFTTRFFGRELDESEQYFALATFNQSKFSFMLKQCCEGQDRSFVDDRLKDGTTVHAYARRLSVNPVTGATAIVVAVLSITDANDGTSYAAIARALAADYFNIFYVNIETDTFIQYTSPVGEERLATERRGEDFFAASRRDAMSLLHPDDREVFVETFTKENIMHELDVQGTFALTYRLLTDGNPVYVTMKAMRMSPEGKHIIVGVSNVDSQMRANETLNNLRSERIGYQRVMALAGNYICLYVIDPKTGAFSEYSATDAYKSYKLPKEGPDFFSEAQNNASISLVPEDLDLYRRKFTMENVMREIEQNGLFELRYRIVLNGSPMDISLRAALVAEPDGDKLIVGVSRMGGK